MRVPPILALAFLGTFPGSARAQVAAAPPARDAGIGTLVEAVSAQRIERDIRALAGFGTRHTLSATLSETRGIGAARRWIHAELERAAAACDGCLRVTYQRTLVDSGPRIPSPTWVVNVVATLPGASDSGRVLIMSAHYDSRASDALDFESDAPGANDDASGTAAVLEAARVLAGSGRRFPATIVLAALAGEEQGLYGGQHLAETARERGWRIEGVLNNDIVGNIQGQDGIED